MRSIDELVDTLCNDFGAVFHSSFTPLPKDVDIYVPIQKKGDVHFVLEKAGFIRTFRSPFVSIYAKFLEDSVYILDIVSDFNRDVRDMPRIFIRDSGNRFLGENRHVYRHVKKILRRNPNTIINEASKNIALNFFSNNHYVRIDKRYLNRIENIHKTPMSLYQKFICYKGVFGTGKSIAFVGPDGSKKTTIIDKLSLTLISSRKIHMEIRFFIFRPCMIFL